MRNKMGRESGGERKREREREKKGKEKYPGEKGVGEDKGKRRKGK